MSHGPILLLFQCVIDKNTTTKGGIQAYFLILNRTVKVDGYKIVTSTL
jgi:hypothetical protein